MNFRLRYRGQLRSQSSSTKEGKQALRRYFHLQLKDLWQRQIIPLYDRPEFVPLRPDSGDGNIGLYETAGAFTFAPLVSQAHGWHAVADLDILFLRPSK